MIRSVIAQEKSSKKAAKLLIKNTTEDQSKYAPQPGAKKPIICQQGCSSAAQLFSSQLESLTPTCHLQFALNPTTKNMLPSPKNRPPAALQNKPFLFQQTTTLTSPLVPKPPPNSQALLFHPQQLPHLPSSQPYKHLPQAIRTTLNSIRRLSSARNLQKLSDKSRTAQRRHNMHSRLPATPPLRYARNWRRMWRS